MAGRGIAISARELSARLISPGRLVPRSSRPHINFAYLATPFLLGLRHLSENTRERSLSISWGLWMARSRSARPATSSCGFPDFRPAAQRRSRCSHLLRAAHRLKRNITCASRHIGCTANGSSSAPRYRMKLAVWEVVVSNRKFPTSTWQENMKELPMLRAAGGAQGRKAACSAFQGHSGFQPSLLTDGGLPSPASAFSNLCYRSGPCLPKTSPSPEKRGNSPLFIAVIAEQTGKMPESRPGNTGATPGRCWGRASCA